MTTHEERALEHLAEGLDAREHLRIAYCYKPLNFELIGRLKADQRFHLDVAQVYASLAAAEATSTLARRPSTLPSYGGGVLPAVR